MSTFGEMITVARKAKGITQEQLAQALHVSRQTVSHWENGRMQPTAEVIAQLNEQLGINLSEQAAQEDPTPTSKNNGNLNTLIAFICGILATLVVVYGIIPLFSTPAHPAATTVDVATLAAMDEEAASTGYSWDWFQQPAVNEEDKAYLAFSTLEVPLKLTKNHDASAPYSWNIFFRIDETNGIDFTVKKLTEEYFGSDHNSIFSNVLLEAECNRFWENSTIGANIQTFYNTDCGVSAYIGYGIALEGTDANGNDLSFGYYIPLSQEMEVELLPEHFQLDDMQPVDGQAFLRITPDENAAYLIEDPEYDGGLAWEFLFSVENESDVPFTVSSMSLVLFNEEAAIEHYKHSSEGFAEMYGSDTMKKGDEPFTPGVGTYKQALTGIGCMLSGVDANGNELTFASYVTLIPELREQ